jgi:hypothetical protein
MHTSPVDPATTSSIMLRSLTILPRSPLSSSLNAHRKDLTAGRGYCDPLHNDLFNECFNMKLEWRVIVHPMRAGIKGFAGAVCVD